MWLKSNNFMVSILTLDVDTCICVLPNENQRKHSQYLPMTNLVAMLATGDTCSRATVKNGQKSITLDYNSRNSVSKLRGNFLFQKKRRKLISRDKDSHLF